MQVLTCSRWRNGWLFLEPMQRCLLDCHGQSLEEVPELINSLSVSVQCNYMSLYNIMRHFNAYLLVSHPSAFPCSVTSRTPRSMHVCVQWVECQSNRNSR